VTASGPIVLVGFMGAGKTTVGRLLAARLGRPFVDLDRLVEERAGEGIPELFRTRGEPAFRGLEREAAREALRAGAPVLAAGGGAFADPETREVLREGTTTVWLRCALPALLARVPLDGSRPLATNHETIVRLLAEREPSYRLADLTVDTTQARPADVSRTILEALFGPGEAAEGNSR
jgi:shikimate kinase/3-dehydroquinate synthase